MDSVTRALGVNDLRYIEQMTYSSCRLVLRNRRELRRQVSRSIENV